MNAVVRKPSEPMAPAPEADLGPQAEAAPPMTVLVVDGDGVSRRFIELAFAKDGGFQVEAALDGAGALDILAHTTVHAIIAETELLDMSGLNLFRRLSAQSRLREIPFLLLSSDTRVATRIAAFGDGVDDFLLKPCDVTELVARVKSLIQRHRHALETVRRRGYMLAGRFSALSFPDLVSIIEQARRSGTLSIVGERSVGAVYFDAGCVVHASFGNLSGRRAFQALMEEPDAQFEFSQEPCAVPEESRSIKNSVTSLILDAARIIDARNYELVGRGGIPEKCLPKKSATAKPAATTGSLAPALVVSPRMVANVIHSLGDAYALGDLRLYTQSDLTGLAQPGRQRFQVHLVADRTEAASAILALAGAPTEQLVAGSLTPEAKALGLTFSLRHDLLLDVIHVDIAQPRAFLPALPPAQLLLLAPPGGDFLAIGTRARVELEQLLLRTAPTAVMGIGNQALGSALRSLPGLREHARLRSVEGALGHSHGDLRSLLVEGIRLYSSPPAGGGKP
jgi:CheY-like chemotaxis protein